MKLLFTPEEQLCIHYYVQAIIKADRLIRPEENVCRNTIMLKMKWPEPDSKAIAAYSDENAVAVLAAMDDDKKRFVTAFFTMILLADQQIAPEEMDLLHRITVAAQLPHIPTKECAEVLNSYLQ